MSSVSDSASQPREMIEIVGAGFVRVGSDSDAVDNVRPRFVVEPGTPTEVARVLAAASAAGSHVIPRGSGTKMGWGNPPRGADIVLSLRRLDRVLEHAAGDMTATVEAGCTIESLQRTLAQRGQRLSLDPLWPGRATVGGVLATADSGPLRWAFGPPRDLVLGVTVALADGTLARSGGKVVKNVAGYDLPKLFAGSFGTLGVITQATFRLHPLPEAVRELDFMLSSREAADRFLVAMRESMLLTAAVQMIVAPPDSWIARVRVEGPAEAIDAKVKRVTQAALGAGTESGSVAILQEAARPAGHPLTPSLSPQGEGDRGSFSRERLFEPGEGPSLLCKLGVPPARLHELFGLLSREDITAGVAWRLVAQGFGLVLLRLDAAGKDRLLAAVRRLRLAAGGLGGTLVVLGCPAEWKPELGVWGEPGDAAPLMRQVKEQFDPAGTLNPGRFVGGI